MGSLKVYPWYLPIPVRGLRRAVGGRRLLLVDQERLQDLLDLRTRVRTTTYLLSFAGVRLPALSLQ